MLYLISIHTYTQVGSVQQETRQGYTINQKRYSPTLVIIKQHKVKNERKNKTS